MLCHIHTGYLVLCSRKQSYTSEIKQSSNISEITEFGIGIFRRIQVDLISYGSTQYTVVHVLGMKRVTAR